MDLRKLRAKAKELFIEHNLTEWSFDYDGAVQRLGQCIWIKKNVKMKKITMSRKMSEMRTDKEVMNTLLHEIAHAIDYEQRGTSDHSDIWRKIALSIGCDGNRCSTIDNEVMTKSYKWLAVCKEHGTIGGWSRKPKNNKICNKCKERIDIVKNF